MKLSFDHRCKIVFYHMTVLNGVLYFTHGVAEGPLVILWGLLAQHHCFEFCNKLRLYLPFWSWIYFSRKHVFGREGVMILRACNQVLCNVMSFDFYDMALHHWITTTSYDKFILHNTVMAQKVCYAWSVNREGNRAVTRASHCVYKSLQGVRHKAPNHIEKLGPTGI